jgi:hypothetical protein
LNEFSEPRGNRRRRSGALHDHAAPLTVSRRISLVAAKPSASYSGRPSSEACRLMREDALGVAPGDDRVHHLAREAAAAVRRFGVDVQHVGFRAAVEVAGAGEKGAQHQAAAGRDAAVVRDQPTCIGAVRQRARQGDAARRLERGAVGAAEDTHVAEHRDAVAGDDGGVGRGRRADAIAGEGDGHGRREPPRHAWCNGDPRSSNRGLSTTEATESTEGGLQDGRVTSRKRPS